MPRNGRSHARVGQAMTTRKLLITGCGRSGTKYITFLLQRLDLDVGHEKLGRDGVASWYMAVDADSVPFGPARREVTFEYVYHQVRHPLSVIASATTFKDVSWQFICAHQPIGLDEPLLLRCAKYWYYWNLEAEKIAQSRYRVEDLHASIEALCERLGRKADRARIESVSKDVNTRSRGRAFHIYEDLCGRLGLEPSRFVKRCLEWFSRPSPPPVVTWETLRALDRSLTEKIQSKAAEYGYEV